MLALWAIPSPLFLTVIVKVTSSPTYTSVGSAVLVMSKTTFLTVILVVLLVSFSVSSDLTTAVLLKVPFSKTVTTTLTVTVSPGAISSIVHLTVWPETVASGVLETYSNALSNSSVITALWAVDWPLLVTVIVKVTSSPT